MCHLLLDFQGIIAAAAARSVSDSLRPVTAMVKLPLILPGEYAVTETEPPDNNYQGWMMSELDAIDRALPKAAR